MPYCSYLDCWQRTPCPKHPDRLQQLTAKLNDPLSRVDHSDPSRSGVATTAQLVCAIRARESAKPEGERFFYDPCASALAGPGVLMITTGKQYPEVNEMVVFRTRAIDEEITRFTQEFKSGQLVVLGAGLDCRPYRLQCLSSFRVFELDFQSVFNEKGSVLKANNFEPVCASYNPIGCDLSQPGWREQLVNHPEFKAAEPTLYLLEGFCGYLKESELVPLLEAIAGFTSGPTEMIATWIGPGIQSHTSLHQFFTTSPTKFLNEKTSWSCYEELSLGEMAVKFNRTAIVRPTDRTFFFSLSKKRQEPPRS